MLRVNGFYGHVRRNDLRSLAMFAGFVVAFQIVAAVALLPPLLLFDLRHAPFLSLGYFERYVPIVLVLSVAFFLLRFLRHVASVRAMVHFVDIDRRRDPRLVNIVETQAIAAGLPLPKVGVIESQARNAFACGLSPSSAVVVVTRGLLEALDDEELAAVVAHEVAHIRNGDIRLMAAANVLMENLLWVQHKSLLRGVGWKTALLVLAMPALLLLFGAAGFIVRVAFTIARVSRLLISSSREFVADAEAVRLTHNPAALISALRQIEGRSTVAGLSPQADAMMIDGAVEGPFATHPTIAERIAVLARLSGAWAEADRLRKDTRTSPEPSPAVAPWRRRGATAPAAAPARFLVQRVNAGAQESICGTTPIAKHILRVGFLTMLGLQIWWVIKTHTAPEPPERTVAARSEETRQRREVERLSALNPVEARCFATDAYRVGDRGLHRVHAPDGRLIEAYARGEAGGSSDIKLERYLGLRLRSVRAVAGAGGADLDRALLDYVKTRKSMLQVVHRFFDEPGLRLMREAYDSPRDIAILDTLRRRLRESAPALAADKRVAAEIELLVSAPEAFIPCIARAA
jgi:Zn-dependent protease with chaperone function